MSDTTFKFRVDDSDLEKSMSRIADQIERTDNEYKNLEKSATSSLQSIADDTTKTANKLNDYADKVEKATEKSKQANAETGRLGKGLKSLFGNIAIGGTSINGLSDTLGSLKEGLKDVGSGAQAASKGSSLAVKGLGALGGAALAVVAVIGVTLVAAFSKFQGYQDKLRIGFAQAKAGVDIALTALGKWGNQLVLAATGQKSLGSAISDAKRETAGFNDELQRQIKLEGQLEKGKIGLERQKQEQAAFASLQKQEIERLNLIADNTTNSFKDRENAAKKRGALTEQLGKIDEERLLKEIALNARVTGGQETQIKAAKEIVKLSREGNLTTEQLAARINKTFGKDSELKSEGFTLATKVFGQIGELGDAQETLLGIQSEAFNQAQSIRAEQAAAAKAEKERIAGLQKRLQELLALSADAEARLGDSGDAITLKFNRATVEVTKLKDEYTLLAKQLKTGETPADIDRLFAGLQEIANLDFERAKFGESLEVVSTGLQKLVKAATNSETGNITDIITSQTATPLADRLRSDGLAAGQALADGIKQGQARQSAIKQDEANQQAKDLIAGLAPEAINAFFEAEQARFQLQIAQQDALIAKINERLQTEKGVLAEQQKLKDDGFANDVAGAKKKVDEEQRALKDAEDKKIEIERKAAKQRAIIAAGEQAVQLTLAVAKLISAEASKGLIGLVLALGGIAIISRLLSASRQQAAAEAGKTAAYATGTEFVEGKGTGTSDSVNARLSRGERVLTAKDNEVLGQKTLSNRDLVKFAILGQRIAKDPVYAYAMGLGSQQKQLEDGKLSLQVDVMKDAYREAAILAADKQIGYWKSRPIEYRNELGEMVREWSEGNKTIRQIEIENVA
jgi:hypothetical protein